jgi:uncharacterized protein YjbI with pentapeptide repeats
MNNLDEFSQLLTEGVLPEPHQGDFFVDKHVSNIIFPDLGDISSFFFKGTIFRNVIFSEFSFFGADLGEVSFINCCFTDCSMNKSAFYQSSIFNCTFSNTSFRRVRISEANIENCALMQADFSGAIITRTTISNSVLSNQYAGIIDKTILINSIWGGDEANNNKDYPA